jgi:hypothetical protein
LPRVRSEQLAEHDLAEHLRGFDLTLLGAVSVPLLG